MDEDFPIDKWLPIWIEERLLLFIFDVITPLKTKPIWYDKVKKAAHNWLFNQLRLTQVSHQINQAFEKAGINYVFLKGQPLNQQLWHNKIIRMSNDIDVLVSPSDILKAHKILKTLGFATKTHTNQLRLHQKMPYLLFKKDATYFKPNFPNRIELHWKTAYTEIIFKNEKVWQKNKKFINQFPIVNDLDNLLYLCYHAALHRWHRKMRLLDLVIFMGEKKISPKMIRAYAKKKNLSLIIEEAFYLMEHYFGLCMNHNLTLKQQKRLHMLIDASTLFHIPRAPFLLKLKKLSLFLTLYQKSSFAKNSLIRLRFMLHSAYFLVARLFCENILKREFHG